MPSISSQLYVNIQAKNNYSAAPHCLICGFVGWTTNARADFQFQNLRYPRQIPICPAEDLESSKIYRKKTWWNTSRMLLYDPENGTCRISGVVLQPAYSTRVPLDENDGYYNSYYLTPEQRQKLVEPTILSPSTTPKDLVGYYIHSRCWELLSSHELGTVAERDMGVLRLALQTRYMQAGSRPKCWKPHLNREDPVRTKCVSDAIGLALDQEDRRKAKIERNGPPKSRKTQQARSCNLPMDVMYMIFDYLPSQTALVMEKELGIHMSNVYWRSRISAKFFYEIEDIADDEVDWKRLCLKLERRLKSSTALAIRRYLLECMDDIMQIARAWIDD